MNLKKLTSLLLSLVMMVTLLPFAAMAEEVQTAESTKEITDVEMYYNLNNGQLDSKNEHFNFADGFDYSIPYGANGTSYLVFKDGSTVIEPKTVEVSKENVIEANIKNSYVEITFKTIDTTGYNITFNFDGYASKTLEVKVFESPSFTPQYMVKNTDGSYPTEWTNFENVLSLNKGEAPEEYRVRVIYGLYADENKIDCTALYYDKIQADNHSNGKITIIPPDENNPYFVIKPTEGNTDDGDANIGLHMNYDDDINNVHIHGGTGVTFKLEGFVHISNYKDATVLSTTAGSTAVLDFGAVRSTNSDVLGTGFAVSEEGKLVFNSKDLAAGNYDATVNGKLYTAVIFPSFNSMTDLTEDLAIKVNTNDDTIKNYLQNSSFATGEYNFVTFNNGVATDITNTQDGNFGVDANGAYTPVYVYKTSNNALVNLYENNNKNYMIQAANGMAGKTSYLIKTEELKIDNKIILKVYPLTSYAGTTVKKNTMVYGQITVFKTDGSAVNRTVATTISEPSLAATNGYGVYGPVSNLWSQVETGMFDNQADGTFYIGKNNAAVLYDTIDISTLKVQSTNGTNVKIAEFLTKKGNENAIGFRLSQPDLTKFQSELIKVSFETVGSDTVEYFYIPVVCRDKEAAVTTTLTPNKASELQKIYDEFNGTVLYLEEGEYATDLYMWRQNLTIIGKGRGAVFTGTEGSTKPIITFGYGSYANTNNAVSQYDTFRYFRNIAVDGKDNTRTGICSEDDVTINLMSEALSEEFNFDVGFNYVKNCAVGVTTNMTDGVTMNLRGITLQNNTTAIKTPVELGVGATEIVENNFIGNGTDIETTSNTLRVNVPQNFFAEANGTMKANGAPKVVGTTSVNYIPYYTTADRDTVQAQISPVATVANASTKLKLPVSLLWTDKAVKLDKTLFEQIYAVKDTTAYEVSVPVTDKNSKVNVIWNFDSAKLSTTQPDATTLKVTNTLSSKAQEVVNTIDTSKTTVAQAVNFSHSGNLPGETTVYVLKDGTTTIENLKLYYINTTTNKLELVNLNNAKVTEVTVDGSVYYAVTIDHCSEYIITTDVVLKETSSGDTGNAGGSTTTTPQPTATPSATTAPTATKAPTKVPTATKTPTANDFISAQEVEEKLEKATGDKVVFDITEKELVSVKAFELLEAEGEKALIFETDEYRWTFEAKDITNSKAVEGTTFKPSITLDSPNKDVVKALVGEANITNIYFEHHGDLPGKAKIEVFVGETDAGVTKYVYHYNPSKSGFEYIDTIIISSEGWAEFYITHCSDYILSDVMLDESIVITEETDVTTEPSTETEDKDDIEQTVTEPTEESSMGILPIILIIVIVLCAVVIFIKKKKSE